MRLLIIGALSGQIGAASQIAVSRGAKVSHANDIDTAMRGLCNGQGADLVMVDTTLDITHLVSRLKNERISIPVVACGVEGSNSCPEAERWRRRRSAAKFRA